MKRLGYKTTGTQLCCLYCYYLLDYMTALYTIKLQNMSSQFAWFHTYTPYVYLYVCEYMSRSRSRFSSKKHGRRSRGTGDSPPPPEFGVGDANVNCPPQILSYRYKKSVQLRPSKYAKIRFRTGLCPGPRWGSWKCSPDPIVGCGRDTPPHTLPHAAPTHLRRSPCVPPEFQPDLRL